MFKIKNITLIGAGNVATNLAYLFSQYKFNINQVYSNNLDSAQNISKLYNAKATNNLKDINKNSDFYIISVSDNAYKKIINKLEINTDSLIVHTSGNVSINIFKNKFKNYGVFYPLQTFTKDKILDFKNIPICLECNSTNYLNILKSFSSNFSNNVNILDSNQRKTIHLAAVFANNFTNHMINLAFKIIEKNNINPEILFPLITETTNKILNNHPKNIQTGPAKRNDINVVAEHIEMLNKMFISKDIENIANLYKFVSENIKTLNEK